MLGQRAFVRVSRRNLVRLTESFATGERLCSATAAGAAELLPTDSQYDIAIVGGGHNALVCAAYLGRAGLKCVVLESREILGGAAVTEELFPGFKYVACIRSFCDSCCCWLLKPSTCWNCTLDVLDCACRVYSISAFDGIPPE